MRIGRLSGASNCCLSSLGNEQLWKSRHESHPSIFQLSVNYISENNRTVVASLGSHYDLFFLLGICYWMKKKINLPLISSEACILLP